MWGFSSFSVGVGILILLSRCGDSHPLFLSRLLVTPPPPRQEYLIICPEMAQMMEAGGTRGGPPAGGITGTPMAMVPL